MITKPNFEVVPTAKISLRMGWFRTFSKALEEDKSLLDSISEVGMLSAIHVAPDPDNQGQYFVIDGSRRLGAVRLLKHPDVNCLVYSSDVSMNELSLLRFELNRV